MHEEYGTKFVKFHNSPALSQFLPILNLPTHNLLGPIVRVSPHELQCNDPDFYSTIYAPLPNKRDKYEKFTKSPDCNNATGFTVEHTHHRLRRDALAPFFSKRNTVALESNIKDYIDRLCAKMAEHHALKQPFNLTVGSLANEANFPEPHSFVPERWLVKNENGEEIVRSDLKKYLVSFGGGIPYYLGSNIANAELYLLAAALAMRVDLELYETTVDDVKIHRDWTIPQPKPNTKGVRVMVRDVHM